MRPIEQEDNIEVLRQYVHHLEKTIKDLSKKIHEYESAEAQEKQDWLTSLEDELSRLRKRFFDSGREKLAKADRPVGHCQPSLNLHGKYPQENLEEEKSDNSFQSDAQTNLHKIAPETLADAALELGITRGAKAWELMKGVYQDSREITVIERIYLSVLHRRCKYRLKRKYNRTGGDVIITAPGPVKLRPGSKYSVDFAVTVVKDKYEYHMPLERQRRQMEAQGLKIDVKTLYGLCEAVAGHCEKVLPEIKQEIHDDFCAVHLDESPWPIIGDEKKNYMWVLSNRKGSFYQFEPTRSGKVADELLKGYEGSVLTDGYGGYNRVKNREKIRLGHCWAHARREFFERIGDYPESEEAVRLIDRLFEIESRAKDFNELAGLRKTESKAITEKLHSWMLRTRANYLKQDGIHRAISYCLKFWPELTRFLKDLSLPLSNNDAERALRHVVMGRKNFSGSKTINGADTAATIYTVIETCKKVGLQPAHYLKYLITENWHGDVPKTPLEYSMEKFGPSQKVAFPEKEAWKVADHACH